jgi:hypothetical protein
MTWYVFFLFLKQSGGLSSKTLGLQLLLSKESGKNPFIGDASAVVLVV